MLEANEVVADPRRDRQQRRSDRDRKELEPSPDRGTAKPERERDEQQGNEEEGFGACERGDPD